MNRSNKVRGVYAVLKDVMGDDMSNFELLKCAGLMVEASEESIYEPVVNLNVGPPPICELPLHVVFEHMSWKVMNREMQWEDDYIPRDSQEKLIEQCIAQAA